MSHKRLSKMTIWGSYQKRL